MTESSRKESLHDGQADVEVERILRERLGSSNILLLEYFSSSVHCEIVSATEGLVRLFVD